MKIRFQGFELAVRGNRIIWDEYIGYLVARTGRETFFRPFDRIICIDPARNDDYIRGLFVTIKNQKRFCEIKQSDGRFELMAHDLQEGNRIADFNFFIINQATHKGIYQYYHQSCSLSQFLSFLMSQFLELRIARINDIRPAALEGNTEAKGALAALKRCDLSTCALVKRETFDQLLDQFREIKEIRMDLTTYQADEPWYTPLRDQLKRKSARMLFKPTMAETIRHGIRRVIQHTAADDVKVKGISGESGLEMTIALYRNLDDFGRYDYNDLTEQLFVALDRFMESQIVNFLLAAARENDHIFE